MNKVINGDRTISKKEKLVEEVMALKKVYRSAKGRKYFRQGMLSKINGVIFFNNKGIISVFPEEVSKN